MSTYTILHNVEVRSAKWFDGYQSGDHLVRGYSGQSGEGLAEEVLEQIFAKHNRDDRPDGQQAPSLSVGDVVRLDSQYWAVQAAGFDNVTEGFLDHTEIIDRPWLEVVKEMEAKYQEENV
jgi:hypothetical protein